MNFQPGLKNFSDYMENFSPIKRVENLISGIAQTGLTFHVIANSVLQGFYRKPGWKFIPGWKSPCNQPLICFPYCSHFITSIGITCDDKPCSDNAICVDFPDGTFTCECKAGFFGHGYTCYSKENILLWVNTIFNFYETETQLRQNRR